MKESISAEPTFSLSKSTKLLNILIRQQKYEEAQQLLEDMISKDKSIVKEKEVYLAELLIAVGLNKEIPLPRRNSYIAEQIMNHSEAYTLEHIKRCHSTESHDKSFFANDIDIEALYEEVKMGLSPEYLVSKGVLYAGVKNKSIGNKIPSEMGKYIDEKFYKKIEIDADIPQEKKDELIANVLDCPICKVLKGGKTFLPLEI